MPTDRYLKAILTIIALELLWIGFNHATPTASAQGGVTPVIIRGIQLEGAGNAFLPVGVVGSYRQVPGPATAALEPLVTRVQGVVSIESGAPLLIRTDEPLKVEMVDYTPKLRPGE